MAWRIVVQPNGLYARWSDVVDNFTDYDMTRAEAYELCRDAGGIRTAEYKMANADKEPKRFEEAIDMIREVHGMSEALNVREELSQNEASRPE